MRARSSPASDPAPGAGPGVSAHALTHADTDHYGSSHAVCEPSGSRSGAVSATPTWREGARPAPGEGRAGALVNNLPLPDPHAVERKLKEGDGSAGSRSWTLPGHSPGHISFWRDFRPHAHLWRRLLRPQPVDRTARPSRTAAAPHLQRRPKPRVRPPRCSSPARARAVRPWPAIARHRALGALRPGAAGLSGQGDPHPCHH